VGLIAAVEPFPGRLAAEAEADFARYQVITPSQDTGCGDMAYHVKMGGEVQHYRYSALYERTGPRYRLVVGDGPDRDSEGVRLKMGAEFPLHTLDLNLSRFNDNLDDSDLYPRAYRYEAGVSYSYKGIASLPLALQYRKSLLDGVRTSDGATVRDADSDYFGSKANYLVKSWDFGARCSYKQRTDRLRDTKEMKTTTIGFSPRFIAHDFSVAPDLTVSRSRDFLANADKDTYGVQVDLKGAALRRALSYDVKGVYRTEQSSAQLLDTDTVGVKVKLKYDLTRLLKSPLISSIGVKGEYNRTIAGEPQNGGSDYALLFLLDSGNLF
jgi:hypothetical protein